MNAAFAIALGANLPSPIGPPAATVQSAIRALAEALGPLAVSRLWVSAAIPSGPDFVNAAVAGRTDLRPAALLGRLHALESRLGRTRRARWDPRVIDLDLLFVGGAVLPDAEGERAWRTLPPERWRSATPDTLVLPHPRIEDRAFVLKPLVEVAPGWRSPVTGRSAAEALARLPAAEAAATRALGG